MYTNFLGASMASDGLTLCWHAWLQAWSVCVDANRGEGHNFPEECREPTLALQVCPLLLLTSVHRCILTSALPCRHAWGMPEGRHGRGMVNRSV